MTPQGEREAPARVAIVGAGSWGTALAIVLARGGHSVHLVVRDPHRAHDIATTRRNAAYLPDVVLDPRVIVGSDLSGALDDAEIAILAVPTRGMRTTAERCASELPPACAVISAAKGFEPGTGAVMTDVLDDILGAAQRDHVLALSGPNIALEIAQGLPAATVIAGRDPSVLADVRDRLTGGQLRVYSNPDLTGVQFGGAFKNVIAIAAGVCDGLDAGGNGKAAIVTRGLAEMARLGEAAGADVRTFSGLTGLGDCMLTCSSPHSRNRRLGEDLARGCSLAEAQSASPMVVEGVSAAREARALGRRLGVETPIVDEVYAVLYEGKPLLAALEDLMRRHSRDEISPDRPGPRR